MSLRAKLHSQTVSNNMKRLTIICALLLVTVVTLGQDGPKKETIFLSIGGLFKSLCSDSIARPLNLEVKLSSAGCLSPPPDEILHEEKRNDSIINSLTPRLGENWYQKFISDVKTCQNRVCDFDSLDLYYGFGLGNSLYLRFNRNQAELNSAQKCILKNHLLRHIEWFKEQNISFRLSSYSAENEDFNTSQLRMNACTRFLFEMGVDTTEMVFTDYKASMPKRSDPNDRENRILSIGLIQK